MIYTVTFNPAIDYIAEVSNLKMNEINRATSERILAGGKGISSGIGIGKALILKKEEIKIENSKAKELIEKEKVNSVYAVEQGLGEMITNFRNIEDEYISERANDIEDLFMDSEQMPTEEEQFESYKEIGENMKDKLSIIRTLDAGGDKNIPYLNLEKEDNPFLGYRAIRVCLGNPEMFKTQLRAILRASIYGNLAIMFPMISTIDELRQAKQILEKCKKELDDENIKYNKEIKVGMMIEIPAAAIMAESFAKECDFFSIGTNDLIQYTVAAERGNPKVANLYTKNHPAIIRLIKLTVDAAHKYGIFCGNCGEAASNFQYIPLLIGMGLNELSMNSSAILQAKKTITELDKRE